MATSNLVKSFNDAAGVALAFVVEKGDFPRMFFVAQCTYNDERKRQVIYKNPVSSLINRLMSYSLVGLITYGMAMPSG